jgi:hypothetical protein
MLQIILFPMISEWKLKPILQSKKWKNCKTVGQHGGEMMAMSITFYS